MANGSSLVERGRARLVPRRPRRAARVPLHSVVADVQAELRAVNSTGPAYRGRLAGRRRMRVRAGHWRRPHSGWDAPSIWVRLAGASAWPYFTAVHPVARGGATWPQSAVLAHAEDVAEQEAIRRSDRSRRLRRRVLAAIAATAVGAAAVVAGVLVVQQRHPQAPPRAGGDTVARAAGTDQIRSAEQWVLANIPPGAAVGTDAKVAVDLTLQSPAGSQLNVTDLGASGLGNDAFVVSTPAARKEAAGNPIASAALVGGVPIAAFGSGPTMVQVCRVGPDGQATLLEQWAADGVARETAGVALSANPLIQADPATRGRLATGALDLRAATVLALLAGSGDVRVARIVPDPAQPADQPIRTVQIQLSPPSRLAATLAGVPDLYRPRGVQTLPDGSQLLQWDLSTAPIQSVS